MLVLDLYSGSGSVAAEAKRIGVEVFRVDKEPFPGIDLVADLEFVTPEQLPSGPFAIWASPPCTTYSLAAISTHRHPDGTPKTDFAKKSDRLVQNTIRLINAFPNAIYYIENPVGMLGQMHFMRGLPKTTVWYCRYGDTRAKPTNIWTNNLRSLFNTRGWNPRPECYRGNRACHHERAPRGSKTGTQGLRNAYERSKIPPELCYEVLVAALQNTNR